MHDIHNRLIRADLSKLIHGHIFKIMSVRTKQINKKKKKRKKEKKKKKKTDKNRRNQQFPSRTFSQILLNTRY